MNDQQPAEQGDEPTVAHYRRTDPGKEPRSLLGQQAAVEGMAAANGWQQVEGDDDPDTTGPSEDHPEQPDDDYQAGRSYSSVDISRRIKRRRLQPTDAARRFAEQALAELIQHERDSAARRAQAGDTNPYDLDPYADVHDLAEQYDQARTHTDDPADLEQFLDNLADDLDLADIRALRLAGEAAVAVTSRAIRAARDRGMKPPQIADELGLTPSRVYQVLRELAAEQGEQQAPDNDQ